MQELRREVYLGRISRGKADFRVTLIIEWNNDYPTGGNIVRLYVRCGGRKYPLFEKIDWLVGDMIRPANPQITDLFGSLYILHEIYMSFRAIAYESGLIASIVWREFQEKRRYTDDEFSAAAKEICGNDVEPSHHDLTEIPESTLKWLYSLPGTGASWDDVQASTFVSDEDFMNIISTTG